MINITKKTSTAKTTAYSGRKIQYIVIHYTAGVSSKPGSAANTARYFATSDKDASADFIVDDGTIVQYNPNPRSRYCWAVGGAKYGNKGGRLYGVAKNTNCVSIEICSTNSTGKMTSPNSPSYSFTDAVLKNALDLTKHLMAEYGVDAAHVIRHYDVNGKPCPGIIGWNAESGSESKWAAFKAQLSGAAPSKGNEAYVGKGIGEALCLSPDGMEVRTQARVSAGSVGHVNPGQKVEVLQLLKTGWMKIVWPGDPRGYAYTSNVGGKYWKYTEYARKVIAHGVVTNLKANDRLRVHTGPGTEYPLLPEWPYLANGNEVDILDVVTAKDGSAWFEIRIAGKYIGCVASWYVKSTTIG